MLYKKVVLPRVTFIPPPVRHKEGYLDMPYPQVTLLLFLGVSPSSKTQRHMKQSNDVLPGLLTIARA
jgi:hypothetical protein